MALKRATTPADVRGMPLTECPRCLRPSFTIEGVRDPSGRLLLRGRCVQCDFVGADRRTDAGREPTEATAAAD
jgi:hypothetical protein